MERRVRYKRFFEKAYMTKKRISIIGSTGSIGRSTLDVVRQFPDRFEIVALGAGSNAVLLHEQIMEFSPRLVSVKDAKVANSLRNLLAGSRCHLPEIFYGQEGYWEGGSLPRVGYACICNGWGRRFITYACGD